MVQLTLHGFVDERVNKPNKRTITKQQVASSCLPLHVVSNKMVRTRKQLKIKASFNEADVPIQTKIQKERKRQSKNKKAVTTEINK